FGRPEDLAFVSHGSAIPPETVRRKIDAREVIVAEHAGNLVGHACLEYLWSRHPFLALILVRQDHRRMGVGRALLRFIEGFLRSQGPPTLYSSSQVNEPPPQAWHRHMGFEECGAIAGINPGGVGEVIFRKRLL